MHKLYNKIDTCSIKNIVQNNKLINRVKFTSIDILGQEMLYTKLNLPAYKIYLRSKAKDYIIKAILPQDLVNACLYKYTAFNDLDQVQKQTVYNLLYENKILSTQQHYDQLTEDILEFKNKFISIEMAKVEIIPDLNNIRDLKSYSLNNNYVFLILRVLSTIFQLTASEIMVLAVIMANKSNIEIHHKLQDSNKIEYNSLITKLTRFQYKDGSEDESAIYKVLSKQTCQEINKNNDLYNYMVCLANPNALTSYEWNFGQAVINNIFSCFFDDVASY